MLQGATGIALVFREELLVGLNRQLLGSPAPVLVPAIDRILDAVDRDFDSPVVERVVFPRATRTAAMVYLRSSDGLNRIVASDPRTGRILGEIVGVGLVPFVLFRLHDELLLGNVGHTIGLIEGLGLLFFCVSGLVLARPRQRNAWLIRWRGQPLQRRFDLHRVLGLWLAFFLALSAATGIVLQADVLLSRPEALRSIRATRRNWSHLTPQVNQLSRSRPAGAIEDIRMSPDQRQATILVYAEDVSRPLALDRITIDLVTGQVVNVQRASQETRGTSLLAWIYPLHSGKAFGRARAFLVIIGLGLCVLPLFGILLWLARSAKRPTRASVRREI